MHSIENDEGKFCPFGLSACERELAADHSGKSFRELYLPDTPFDGEASRNHTYLIVGRRGAGKTALAQSFRFSKRFKDPHYIFVEPKAYHEVLHRARHQYDKAGDVDLWRLSELWEHAIWTLIFANITPQSDSPATLSGILGALMSILLIESTNNLSSSEHKNKLQDMKIAAQASAKQRPIVVAIDTLERYSVADESLLKAIAALIQFAQEFNNSFSKSNIHIKVLMSGEIFPHLEQKLLDNPLKSLDNTLFMLWQPKPLLRLIAYRFHHYLTSKNMLDIRSRYIKNWLDYDDVLDKMWKPYFGTHIRNGRGISEETFPYILRHTQMRPRQLIYLCNHIATLAKDGGGFPNISPEHVVKGISMTEERLANEIINSFSQNFENMTRVLNSMLGCPARFKARELDQRAYGIKQEWKLQDELGEYSSDAYKYMLAEMGIIGLVSKSTKRFIEAEFEYSREDRLHLGNDDDCVIHPMFYKRLRVTMNTKLPVLPFSSEFFNGDE